ncbi:ATPase synthesis protein 25 mitochondrial [Maudiozyma exigua]|uniref:ATPase synthesis protein 25 n=1 Tax=Maudiozyma exigua TaxID=34358 RepID=A0A9P7BB40_MAUEX|nr:ATPase synthesis protein 25 mitochondrial [Kazachstania exigua]
MLRLRTNIIPKAIVKSSSSYLIRKFPSLYYSTNIIVPETNIETTDIQGVNKELPTENTKTTNASIPWYLELVKQQNERESVLASTEEPIIFPKDSPESLVRIANFLSKEQGLKNILIFDMRNSDVVTSKIADIMVIATAKSIKHCQGTYVELNRLIKQEFSHVAYLEGNINANDEKKRKKRLLRRTNLGGVWNVNKRNVNTFESNEAWYMVDTKTDNIFVNILTEKRRTELNLEELYSPKDEKQKWAKNVLNETKNENFDDLLEVREENNVLSGLRRLAQQRRSFSTFTRQLKPENKSGSKTLNENVSRNIEHLLLNQRFKEFEEKIKSNKDIVTDNSQASEGLECIHRSLQSVLANGSTTKISIDDWVNAFNAVWPVYLPTGSASFWSQRFAFLKLLVSNQKDIRLTKVFIEEYFKLKSYYNEEITVDEIINFLRLMDKLKDSQAKVHTKKILDYVNVVICDFLELFVGSKMELRIINNSEILKLILSSMINNEERLVSFMRTIDFLSLRSHLSENSFHVIIDTLATNKLWGELFSFWNHRVGTDIKYGKDKRPWCYYIKTISESSDKSVIQKFIVDGSLLWILRYGVEITPDLRKEINDLFNIADPDDTQFKYQKAQFGL